MPVTSSVTSAHRATSRWSSSASPAAAAPLSTVVYRSRSAAPLSESGLLQLVEAAQRRNRAESVTGLLIYDDGRFMQWLEGPADGVARVWESTRQDRRHTDIEILADGPAPERYFPGWDLKLGTRRVPSGTPLASDALELSVQIIASLRRQPSSVRSVLATLVPVESGHEGSVLAEPDQNRLRQLVDGVVIPRLVQGRTSGTIHPQDAGLLTHDPRLAALARMLVAADPAEAFALLDVLNAQAGSVGASCSSVSEPAARSLGDMWAADICTEFDVALGLARLQQAFRRLCRSSFRALPPVDAKIRAVLIAPQPGEIHMLGAVLDAEMLWRAGWDTRCEFPADDQALAALVAGTWFDAIDLSSSLALGREHRLPRMAATISAARRASVNPALAVVVGGRVFVESTTNLALAASIGASTACTSAAEIAPALDRALNMLPLPTVQ